MNRIVIVLAWIGSLAALGCSDEVRVCSDCGQGASGATGGNGGGNGGNGGEGAAGGSSGQGGSAFCGGISGLPCDPGEYCDYHPSTCGVGDSGGTCEPTPQGCPEIYQPTCGCDGTVYGNACEAQAAGVDVSQAGGCAPPDPSLFPCGSVFCQIDSQYCQRSVSDVGGIDDGYGCVPLPGGCADPADCACLAAEPCGDMCSGAGATGLSLTCPGG